LWVVKDIIYSPPHFSILNPVGASINDRKSMGDDMSAQINAETIRAIYSDFLTGKIEGVRSTS